MLVKVVEKLKTDSQGFVLKAAADPKNTHAYATEAKSIMETQKLKRQEMEEIDGTIQSLEKKRKGL